MDELLQREFTFEERLDIQRKIPSKRLEELFAIAKKEQDYAKAFRYLIQRESTQASQEENEDLPLLTEEKLLQAWLAYSQLSRFDIRGNADPGDFTSLGQEAFDFASDFGGDFQRIKVDVIKKGEGLSVYRGLWQGSESIFKSSSNMKNNLDPKITQVSREKYALKALEGSGAPYLPHYLSSGTFVSESGSRFSVVIESLAGLPLLRFLNWPQKGISLDAWAGMRLLASLLSAGLTMIDYGVKHGDIRPQNLLTDGNYFAICDFGYSQIHAKYAAQFEREYPEQSNYPWPLIQDPLFSSLETLRGDESLPVLSDMEAGVYTLAFLLERGLPWRVTDDFATLMEKRVQARDTGSNWPALKRLPTIGRDVCGWLLKNGSKKTVSRQEYMSQIATLNQAIFQKEGIRMPLILPNVIKGVQNSPESDISMQSRFVRD